MLYNQAPCIIKPAALIGEAVVACADFKVFALFIIDFQIVIKSTPLDATFKYQYAISSFVGYGVFIY